MRRKPLVISALFLTLVYASGALASGALAAGAPAVVAPELAFAHGPSERERAERMAREAIEGLMRAFELMIESIPEYEMPEINEDGDIIIRRKRRKGREWPQKPGAPEVDETST